jgi:hypothetical protein
VDLASGLLQEVLSDQASEVGCQGDHGRPRVARVGDQEHTAIEIHAGNHLSLKRRPDVFEIEFHLTSDDRQGAEYARVSAYRVSRPPRSQKVTTTAVTAQRNARRSSI